MLDIDAQCAKAIATLDQLTSSATPVEGVPADDKNKHVHGTLTLKGDEISAAAGAYCLRLSQCASNCAGRVPLEILGMHVLACRNISVTSCPINRRHRLCVLQEGWTWTVGEYWGMNTALPVTGWLRAMHRYNGRHAPDVTR